MKKTFPALIAAAAVALPLALSACSAPAQDEPKPDSKAAESSQSSTPAARPDAASALSSLKSDTPQMKKAVEKINGNAGYASQSNECKVVINRTVFAFVLAAPVFSDELGPDFKGEAKQNAEAMVPVTPSSLKADFDKVEALNITDKSEASAQKTKNAFQPILDWTKSNCNGFAVFPSA